MAAAGFRLLPYCYRYQGRKMSQSAEFESRYFLLCNLAVDIKCSLFWLICLLFLHYDN